MTQAQTLDHLLNHLSQGIVFIDEKGLISTFNPAASTILNLESEKILNSSYKEHFKDDFFGFSLQEAIKNKQTISPMCVHLTSENNIEVEATYKDGLIILIRDVTELRQLQAYAQRNDRLKELGEMAATVAHDIRNPLGGIKGFASLLHRDLKDRPDLQQMAAYIVEGAENLNGLVTRILDFSRPLNPTFELTDLVPLLSDIIAHVEADSRFDSKYMVTIASSHEHIFAWVDPHLLKSAVLNLVVNGFQAMPEGGTVNIDIYLQGRTCLIEVTDKGEGISTENIPKLFTPFFTTKPDGNGFGLAEVLKVIQAHDGEITVKSEEHKGSTFTIKLPNKVSHGH